MIQSCEKKKIINEVESNLPEFIEKEKLLEKIKNMLTELVYNNLTENELNYYKLYPLKCLTGLYIELSKIRFELDENERKNFPALINYDNSDYYKQSIKIYFPGTDKDIINIYYNRSFWEELRSSNPKKFEELKNMVRNFFDLSNKVFSKISMLKDVLELPDMTLTNLKKYYPELYKIAKQ